MPTRPAAGPTTAAAIELRLLRYFIAVAETEHVGRAASQLHISQSPLSRQIRQLEDQLGVELFARERRRIRLTEAGRWLLGPARELVARSVALVREAAELGSGEVGQIAIGFVGAALSVGVLPAALRVLRRTRPRVQIALRQLSTTSQLEGLRNGELDLALVHGWPTDPALEPHHLLDLPYVLAVPRDHRLAGRAVRPADLDDQSWIVVTPSEIDEARWLAAWAVAGFTPNVVVRVVEWSSALALVGAGVGLALVPDSAAASPPANVAIRGLPWLRVTSRLALVRRRGRTSPLVADVARWISEAARAAGPRSRRTRRRGSAA